MSSEIQEFLAEYTDEVRETSEVLRSLVTNLAPGGTETLHSGWKVISYGYARKFCAIAPHGKWVNLQFHAGATLADAQGLLQGSGKAMRHIKVYPGTAIPEGVADLLRAAADAAR